MEKCPRNVNFEEMDTERSRGENDGFWLQWGIYSEIYQTKYYFGSVKKSHFSFSCDLQIDKKINNVKDNPRRKTDSKFDFSQAA